MASIFMKGIVGSSFVIASLLMAQSAFAADCKPPQAFVSGVQEYSAANTNSVVARSGESIRVRMNCKEGKTSGVKAPDGFTKGDEKPALMQKQGSLEVVMRDAYVEFTGPVNGAVGSTQTYTFTDGSGATYTVSVKVADKLATQGQVDWLDGKKADKGDSYTKPESDGRFSPIGSSYTKPESDDRYAGKGEAGGPAHVMLEFAPAIRWRPSFDPSGGVQGAFGYRVGNPMETGFLFKLEAGWAMSSTFPTRAVAGVPHTEQSVQLHTWYVGPMFLADIVAGNYVNIDLGGGILPTVLHYPGTSVGQEANGGTVWGVHSSTQFTLLLQGEASARFFLTNPERKGLYLALGVYPGVELIPTKGTAGGTETSHKFNLAAALGLGGAIPGT